MDTQCSAKPLEFQAIGRRKVHADFDGGHVSSDGGALLLRAMYERLGLPNSLLNVLPTPATLTSLNIALKRCYQRNAHVPGNLRRHSLETNRLFQLARQLKKPTRFRQCLQG